MYEHTYSEGRVDKEYYFTGGRSISKILKSLRYALVSLTGLAENSTKKGNKWDIFQNTIICESSFSLKKDLIN